MRTWLLDYLVCPACKGTLDCTPETGGRDDIETGTLTCTSCGSAYPIVRGIPRMLPQDIRLEQQRTSEAFGWQWQEFNQLHADWATYEDQFLDWVAPLQPAFFRDKIVLDAGCGMGRNTAVAARLGAQRVIGIDISASVEAAYQFTSQLPETAIVQADLYQLPFKSPFDVVFSIGVIHHLPNPPAGLKAIGKHVQPDGLLFAWVYGYENNGWVRNIVTPIRERITARLPRRGLYILSYALTVLLRSILCTLYRTRPDTALSRRLPYYSYLYWLAQFNFRHTHHTIVDHLGVPITHYVRKEDFRTWFEQAGFPETTLTWRNRYSWRGFGYRSAQQGR